MEIVSIFVDEESGEGLYAMRFDEEDDDEWTKLMNRWLNPQYVTGYLLKQASYLQTKYFRQQSIDSLAVRIEREAEELDRLLLDLADQGFDDTRGRNLQQFFKPLDNRDFRLYILQPSKGKLNERPFHPGLLRVYALRISVNTYVITGGAIKLVNRMEEHEDTRLQLQKLEQVHRWLAARDLIDEESIKDFLNEE